MRFSLETLLMICFWLALGVLVWQRWQAWTPDAVVYTSAQESRLSRFEMTDEPMQVLRVTYNLNAPDGRSVVDESLAKALQRLNSAGDVWGVRAATGIHVVIQPPDNKVVYTFPKHDRFPLKEAGFLDNDTYVFSIDDPRPNAPKQYCIYRRRFPEIWWGHFYRAEVWAFLVLTGVLVGRGIRARRSRPMKSDPIPASEQKFIEMHLLRLYALVRQGERSVDRVCGSNVSGVLDFEKGIVAPLPEKHSKELQSRNMWAEMCAWYRQGPIERLQLFIERKQSVVGLLKASRAGLDVTETAERGFAALAKLLREIQAEGTPSEEWTKAMRVELCLAGLEIQKFLVCCSNLEKARHVDHFLDPTFLKMYAMSEICGDDTDLKLPGS